MEKYIKDYLLKYGQVQMPEFGILEVTYKSSYIHPILHKFSVPGKYIVFSENKSQDGDFVSFVSKKEKITVAEAKKRIEMWTYEVWKTIKEEKRQFEVSTLGSFFLNAMEKIEFAAVLDADISPDSFGLEEFKANLPISSFQIVEAEKIEEAGETDLQPKKKGKRVGLWIFLITLLLGGVFVGTVYFVLPDSFAEYKNKGLELFGDAMGKFTKSDANNTNSEFIEEVAIIEAPPIESDTVEIVVPSSQTQMQLTDSFCSEYNYYVIIGSFRESANADKFLKEKQANYSNAVNLGLGKSGYYMVGIGPYSQFEAESKQLEIPNAWIFKK